MTNAEKFLKDNVSVAEFIDNLYEFYNKYLDLKCYSSLMSINKDIVFDFLQEPIKPQLTEDERVILRNIKGTDFEKIGRDKIGGLYILVRTNIPTPEKWTISFYDHLFQFIKERRRILNSRIIRR